MVSHTQLNEMWSINISIVSIKTMLTPAMFLVYIKNYFKLVNKKTETKNTFNLEFDTLILFRKLLNHCLLKK